EDSLSSRLLASIEAEKRRSERLLAEAAEAAEATEEEEEEEGVGGGERRDRLRSSEGSWSDGLLRESSAGADEMEWTERGSGREEEGDDYIARGNEILEAERRLEQTLQTPISSWRPAAEERRVQALREEFVRMMRESFLNGEDRCPCSPTP
ncbi:MAG: hypothetical protein SGPRY_006274, partial [Prymnesium sp.]